MRIERFDRLEDTRAAGTPVRPSPAATLANGRRRTHHHRRTRRPVCSEPGRTRDRQGRGELPRDPRSDQPWSPEPLAGNYSECAQLSAVVVTANTNAANPNTRAVMFHLGKFIPTGVPDTFGFNGIEDSATTGDTVGLKYSSGDNGLDSVVRFRWNGNGVELIGNSR